MQAVHRRQRDAQQHEPGGGKDRPSHWRRPTRKPNSLSAITAMNTTLAASNTWITDIGAIDSAATCRPQLRGRGGGPSVNHLDEYSALAERNGCMTCTFGTSFAPVPVEEAQVRHEGARERKEYA